LEAARQVVIRTIEKNLGKGAGFFFQMRVYPHHILRENPLASGAGADRLSTGMAHSYGKPIGVAAQLSAGQAVFTVRTNKENIALVRRAFKKASNKFPCKCTSVVEDFTLKKKVAKPKAKAEPKPEAKPKAEAKSVAEPKAKA